MSLIAVFEGDTDLPIVRKLVRDAGLDLYAKIDAAGKSAIDAEIASYNLAAQGSPWFVHRDLDQDATCAGELITELQLAASPWMCFRLAVRQLEAWLLADSTAMAKFLGLAEHLIPENPDLEPDSKRTLIDLARRSPKREIRRGMVPPQGAAKRVGPLYETMILEFGERHWSLSRGAARSESLRRARRALRDLGRRWRLFTRGKR